jgi:hypothetical protein
MTCNDLRVTVGVTVGVTIGPIVTIDTVSDGDSCSRASPTRHPRACVRVGAICMGAIQ